jgi:hypothetical protein
MSYTDFDHPFVSSRHYVVCSCLMYGFWLPLWYLQDLCYLFFFDIRIMITPLVSSRHNPYIEEEQTTQCAEDTEGVIKSVYRRRTDNIMSWRYQRGNQIRTSKKNRQHNVFVVCSSLKYGFWLPLCIFKTFCCLFFFDIRIRGNQIRISKKNKQHNVLKIPKG